MRRERRISLGGETKNCFQPKKKSPQQPAEENQEESNKKFLYFETEEKSSF
jgi:hypothetical protein